MTRDLVAALIVVVFLCFLFYKLGQARELIRIQDALRGTLAERDPRCPSDAGDGFMPASRWGSDTAPSRSSSVFDQEARHLEVVDS